MTPVTLVRHAITGRLDLPWLFERVHKWTLAEFKETVQAPLLLQLNEGTAPPPLVQSTTRIPLGSRQQEIVKPVHAHLVTKRPGANAFVLMVTIGRATNNDVVLPYDAVSKFHASLAAREGQWTITDASSKNGVALDGATLAPRLPTPIKSGQSVDFGGAIRCAFLSPEDAYAFLRASSGG